MRTCFQEWNLASWSFLELDSSGSQAVDKIVKWSLVSYMVMQELIRNQGGTWFPSGLHNCKIEKLN